jgi:CheY-like chemotaxis protein
LRAQNLSALVVDDVEDVAEMIALFLKHAGFDVALAHSADEALLLAGARRFDVVVSDIGMPHKNGYELAEALRKLANYTAVPMIAVTGYAEYDDRDRALRSGFNGHLNKPIDPDALLRLIAQLRK